MDKKYITHEQLIAAMIINYSSKVSTLEFSYIVKGFNNIFGEDYEIVNTGISNIEPFIVCNEKFIGLRKGFVFNTRIQSLFSLQVNKTLRAYFREISGEVALRYINIYKNMGCKNCINTNCIKADNIEYKYDEKGLPYGHGCEDWKNNFSKQRVLK